MTCDPLGAFLLPPERPAAGFQFCCCVLCVGGGGQVSSLGLLCIVELGNVKAIVLKIKGSCFGLL